MKPQNYVEGQKFCCLTDLTICRSTDTCCDKNCFHNKNMQINKTAFRYIHVEIVNFQWNLPFSEDQKCLD